MKLLFQFCFILMISISCNRNDNTGSKKPEGQVVLADDTRIIPEDSPLFKKVHLQVILPVNYHLHYSTTGTVQIMTGSLAELSTPFEGRVTKSFVRLGQKILTGSPVFEIYSPAYFETVKSFVQAKQENLLAETNYHRQKELFENGVGSKKEFEEAGAAQQIASRQYETAEASLLIFNVKPDEISLGKPLIVRSPIAGEIVKNQITVGQYLKSDAEPQAVVANLSKIWVVALVTEKNIRMINSNDSVHIIIDGEPIQPINGIVTYIGSILDEQTRSFEVYVECKNDDKSLKPGMFANVAFTRQIQDAIIIPATAVLQEEDHTYVFVQTEKNKFIKRRVSVTTGNNQELIVNSGLKASETIVAEGAVYLR